MEQKKKRGDEWWAGGFPTLLSLFSSTLPLLLPALFFSNPGCCRCPPHFAGPPQWADGIKHYAVFARLTSALQVPRGFQGAPRIVVLDGGGGFH